MIVNAATEQKRGHRRGTVRALGRLRGMNNFEEKPRISKEEREAKKERQRWDAEKALRERKKDDDAFRSNFERLKAERLAQEKISA